MANFVFKNVTAIGTAQVLENGDLIQPCMIETSIEQIVLENKFLNDLVTFTIPNSEMVGKPQPITAAWDYIKNVLAPQWVVDNYSNI
jgi:hypothetical protein